MLGLVSSIEPPKAGLCGHGSWAGISWDQLGPGCGHLCLESDLSYSAHQTQAPRRTATKRHSVNREEREKKGGREEEAEGVERDDRRRLLMACGTEACPDQPVRCPYSPGCHWLRMQSWRARPAPSTEEEIVVQGGEGQYVRLHGAEARKDQGSPSRAHPTSRHCPHLRTSGFPRDKLSLEEPGSRS